MSRYSDNTTTRKPPLPVFFAASVVMFFLTLSAAESIGFVPYYIDGTASREQRVALANLPELGSEQATRTQEPEDVGPVVPVALPDRIVIPAIDLDLPVQNPSTRDIDALDAVLQSGPVRYVDSARLGEKGNTLIFAHTSHLPIVHNQMYKAFNRVPELEAGDTITIQGGGNTYLYVVQSVRRADAHDETIDLSPKQGTVLTLVTCDTLTSKTSRFILEAEFVGVVE